MSAPMDDRARGDGEHEPNSYGFAGGATAPDPDDPDDESPEQRKIEEIAIPDDLPGLFTEGEAP